MFNDKKPEYKYFQVIYEKKNKNPEKIPLCNTVTVFYKGISLVEFYIDDMKEEGEVLKEMHPSQRRKYLFNNYAEEIFLEDYANEVLNDDDYFPPKTLSYKEKLEELYCY